MEIPDDLLGVKAAALRALAPVTPANSKTKARKNFLISVTRSKASYQLPPYYLMYFLLVDLLGFQDLGRSEKTAWSIPVDYMGKAFLIEHRKFGVGIFIQDPDKDQEAAEKIAIRLKKSIKAATRFFDWMANQAVSSSAINVLNNSSFLFDRYKFLRDTYQSKIDEAESRKDERHVEDHQDESGNKWRSVYFPASDLHKEATWLVMSAVDAFFSWTEHVFIHIAIISGKITSAADVASLAEADWSEKYKKALGITEPGLKDAFDSLIAMRKELRNYVAHGAFGKQGEAFAFHSNAGAVPVLLPHKKGSMKFSLGSGLSFKAEAAIQAIDHFITLLWTDSRLPAEVYIQDSGLPLILTMAKDGTYARAMTSPEDMEALVDHLTRLSDDAENMDW